MAKIRNEEIRRRVNMQPAEQTTIRDQVVVTRQTDGTNKQLGNWVKDRRPIVYPLDADGRRVHLK